MSDQTSETELSSHRSLTLEVTVPGVEMYLVPLADKEEVLLGRSRNVDIRLNHRSVSREHARLRLKGEFTVEDLGSGNGTRLRGKALAAHQPTEVGIGEILEIGNVALRLLPERGHARPMGDKLAEEVQDLERRRIEAALVAARGNQSEAARRLGMSRGALLARLRAWGMTSTKRST